MIKIEKLSHSEVLERGINAWPIWEKEISVFPWEYDSDEYCLILQGKVVVKANGMDYHIKNGDFVFFPKGLIKCTWDIQSPLRKHYQIK